MRTAHDVTADLRERDEMYVASRRPGLDRSAPDTYHSSFAISSDAIKLMQLRGRHFRAKSC
jgi:hypothetical protein